VQQWDRIKQNVCVHKKTADRNSVPHQFVQQLEWKFDKKLLQAVFSRCLNVLNIAADVTGTGRLFHTRAAGTTLYTASVLSLIIFSFIKKITREKARNLSKAWHTSRLVVNEVKWLHRWQRGRFPSHQSNNRRMIQSQHYTVLPANNMPPQFTINRLRKTK